MGIIKKRHCGIEQYRNHGSESTLMKGLKATQTAPMSTVYMRRVAPFLLYNTEAFALPISLAFSSTVPLQWTETIIATHKICIT